MNGRRPDVSVILCAGDETHWDSLVAAVRSLESQTLKPLQTIVVVDGAGELRQRVRKELPTLLAEPWRLTVVKNLRDEGPAGSRNTGLACAEAPVVAFLGADVIAPPQWVEYLADEHTDPRVLRVGQESYRRDALLDVNGFHDDLSVIDLRRDQPAFAGRLSSTGGGIALGEPRIKLAPYERPSPTPGPPETPARVPARPRADVSVIICAYTENRWEQLVAAIRSTQKQTLLPRQTVLVVDHAPSLLQRARRELPSLVPDPPSLSIIHNRQKPGLAGARNTGVAHTRAAIVAFLDDDAAAEPDWLERLYRAYDDPSVIGAGGSVDPVWETARPRWFPREFDWVVGCSYRGQPTEAGPVRNFIGTNMSFRRSVLLEAGGFHPDLGRTGSAALGCEETELCILAARQHPDGTLLYQPEAHVRHWVPAGRATWRYFRTRCYAEGQSKAAVTELAGADEGLSAERAYLARTLPAGVATNVVQGLLGKPTRLAAALAIIAGTASTAWGYLAGNRRSAPDPAATGAAAGRRESRGGPLVLLAFALLGWVASLATLSPRHMTDLGLVSVLPMSFWLALTCLTIGFAWLVFQRHAPRWLLVAYVVTLIAVLHATPVIAYGTLRYAWAWKHIGIIDYVQRHGGVDTHLHELSAYQAWPGFFILNALLNDLAGLHSSLSYASWGPPFFELLMLGPLLLIAKRFTSDVRLVWTFVWLFYLGNWVGQDYFSPQAFNFFLYLVVIAVCLRHLAPAGEPGGRAVEASQHDDAAWTPRSTPGTVFLLLPVLAAIATSHQLTPFMLISALVVLAVFRRISPKWLPALMVCLAVGWISYAARTFLADNLRSIIRAVGHPGANTNAQFINLSLASKGQALVARVDRYYSAALWGLAAIGFLRRRRRWRRELPLLLLLLSPLPLIAMNDYGGEMAFRVFMFSLPFAAFYAASAFFPSPRAGRSPLAPVALLAAFSVLLAGFSLSYYGKERTNYFTPAEVTASKWLYATAPPGSLILGAISNMPWAFEHYEVYTYEFFAEDTLDVRKAVINDPVGEFSRAMGPDRFKSAYLILSRSQADLIDSTGVMPNGVIDSIIGRVLHSDRFVIAYANQDALIFTLAPPHTGGST